MARAALLPVGEGRCRAGREGAGLRRRRSGEGRAVAMPVGESPGRAVVWRRADIEVAWRAAVHPRAAAVPARCERGMPLGESAVAAERRSAAGRRGESAIHGAWPVTLMGGRGGGGRSCSGEGGDGGQGWLVWD